VSRLTVQTVEDWVGWREPLVIGVIDTARAQSIAEQRGWSWDEVIEDGLGPTGYLPLAWDGRSRFLLRLVHHLADHGVEVEVSASEDPATARKDLLSDLGVGPDVVSRITEGGVWFARMDPE
jgi:hypothetical protein